MKTPHLPALFVTLSRRHRRRAFSLVEVTLALGIVTFALVSVVGVLPTALASARQSFDQNHAAAIADTLFTSFRSQPFQKVGYLDEQFDADGKPLTSSAVPTLDLNASTQLDASGKADSAVTCYVSFLEGTTVNGSDADSYGEQRRLRFVSPNSFSQQQPTGTNYLVTMHFNNQPAGMTVPPVSSATVGGTPIVPAEANQIEVVVSAVSHPNDQYRFVSTVANRSN